MSEEFIDDIIQNANPEEAVKLEEAAKEEQTQIQPEAKVAIPEVDKSDDKVVDNASEVSVEALAEQLGWNKDYKGPEAVDAATYILRSREIQDTMRGHNKDLKGQIGNLQKSIEALQVHNEKVYQAEVKRLETEISKLKTERRAAVELADVTKVDELDDQIEELQKDLTDSKVQSQSQQQKNNASNDIYPEWIKENAWYENDPEMAAYANKVVSQYEGAPVDRIFNIVTQKVKEVFPDKFNIPAEAKQNNQEAQINKIIGPKSPVEASSRNQPTASFTKADLSAEQVQIMNQFVRQGIMTEQQYINDIAKMQGA